MREAPSSEATRRTSVRDLRTEREGVGLAARDSGLRRGEVVLLLHGSPQDSSCWDGVVPLLHAAGLRTLVMDQRGYGASGSPPGVAPYRTEELAADVVAVLDAAGVRQAHVVGHDWGGAVAWHTAAHHADRVSTLTVLSTPHPAAYSWSLTHSRQPLLSWYTLAFQTPWLPELVLAQVLEPVLAGGGLPPATAHRYAERLRRPVALGPPLAWYRAAVRRPPWHAWRATPAVGVPTTYLWGRRDPALGRAAAERTRRFVSGPYRFIELDEGHWLPELQPEAVARAVASRVAGP
ncbi:alpha/beta fold hydrolase [Oryzobacter terrae]|uniref:alpha/beta fold hydrolase n=1 Tax=Oryzobacter terrae TaxID=1620385 RepID=UPI00366D9F8D